jgi:hypothetical protein
VIVSIFDILFAIGMYLGGIFTTFNDEKQFQQEAP